MSESLQIPSPKITVGQITDADIREALMGTNGNPTYQEQFGITSAPLGTTGAPPPPSMAELELQAKIAEQRALDPTGFGNGFQPNYGQSPIDPDSGLQTELDKFKKLYGESENEKGAARKRETELMEAFTGLMAQYESLQANSQPQTWNQAPQPGFGQPQYPAPPYMADPFEGINDDDVLQGKQLKTLVQNAFAPALQASFQQSQAANARAAALERQLMQQARNASGISKLDEFRLTSKNPWLNGLPEGSRLAAIQSLKQAEVAMQPPPPPQGQQQTQVDTQNRIMSKVTYIEGGRPDVVDTSEAAIEAAKQRDYAKVMSLPAETGERARAFRQLATKYNLNIGQSTTDLSH